MKKFIFLFILLIGGLIIFGCNSNTNGNSVKDYNSEVIVYKSSTCGCCGIYSDYLKSNGRMDVDVKNLQDVSSIKTKFNIPNDLTSCHTTKIGDYFVEGHIPIEAINKLMAEKPDIAGIAMPGMPSGSPGMPGRKNSDFIIYAVNKDGSQEIFMTL